MERKPTCQVYNEIITCHAIFLNQEESRSHGNEREAERAQGQGARPPPLGAHPALVANQGRSLLGILNTNRKIRKRTDTDVAFTREYSRVSIFHRERECTN